MGRDTSFPVIFGFDARAVGKLRTEVSIRMERPWEDSHELATDEPPAYGGEGTAPTPLHTFTTGVVCCLMTQIRVMSQRIDVPLDGAEINGRAEWIARSEDRAPHTAEGVEFVVDITLETSASWEDQLRLLGVARRSCFVEAILRPGFLRARLWDGSSFVEI
jgi:uncharacterized OsmC-like protein